MTYPGNASLSPDVQQRILTTYRQSLQSAARGSRDEALLGCDFVQRLDPQFQPARVLQQMLAANREPEVFVQMLAALDGGGGESESDEDLRSLFARLLAERRFPEILNAAERDKRRVAADPELLSLIEEAQGRHEAEPYVAKFLGEAAAALAEERREDVARLLDKARSLDPSHPGIAEIENLLHPGAAPAAGPADAAVALPDLDFDAFHLPSPDEAGLGVETPDLPAPSFARPDFGAASLDPDDAGEARPAEETSGRIVSLLTEGQEAFDRGDFQPAIDAWSRIFLIDIDHEEAARKIERARQLKSEQEREVEEIFHDGVARFDTGELAASRAAFQKVLALQPSYALAREYLDKIDERESGVELPGGGLPELAPLAPATAAPAAEPRRPSGELRVPAAAAPRRDRGRAPVGQGYVATAKKGAGAPSPRFLLIGGGVLALLAVGGWFLFSQRERLFPNAEPAATSAQPAQADPIAKAQELHAAGKTPHAIAMLRRIPNTDARYDEALQLISQWEAIPAPEAEATGDPLVSARRRALLEQGQTALEAGENFRARRLFVRAAELAPLDGDWITLSATAEERLTPLANEVQQFSDGDYEFLISALWRRREAEPDNRDLQRMLVDAYYNLGVLDLQRGDAAAAREKFREARLIDPADPAIQRLERFAVLYEQRGQDLLYRIFVKYAPLR